MNEINNIIKCINDGGVVLLPTDTVYGLAVSPLNKKAIDTIYTLKSRPRNLNLPIMVSSHNDLIKLGLNINNNAMSLLNSKYVPGALSIVLGFESLPKVYWLSGREEVAIRIPDNKRLLTVLEKTGPLLVTSANKTGTSKTSNNIKDILDELNGVPNLVIDNGIINETPSTIVNCRLNPPVIERISRVASQ